MRNFLLFAGVLLACSAGVAQSSPTVLKIATVAPEGTPWAEGLRLFKEKVEKNSNGGIKVKIFLGGALGDENETVLACKRGQIQGVAATVGAVASQVPDLAVIELPYLFQSAEEADYVLQKALAKQFSSIFQKYGFVFGFWSENGFRHFGSRESPIKTPSDLVGKKMRSQEQPAHIAMWRAFGASPVPIPTTEALTALQTGVVDGYDNTTLFAQAASLTSATKYFTLSGHIYQPAGIFYNAAFFNGLSAENQKALSDAGVGLGESINQNVRAMAPLLEKNLSAFGITVLRLDDGARRSFEELAAKARAGYLAKASKGEKILAKDIEKAEHDFRAGKR